MGSGSTRSTGSGSSRCSSGCTAGTSTRGRASGWPSAARSPSGTAARSPPTASRATGPRSWSPSPSATTRRTPTPMATAAKPITILMADDDPDDRQLTKEAFEESHLANDLRFVEDGEELLDYLYRRGKYAAPGAAP